MKFYGDAYQGETYGDTTEFYQYFATKDGSDYIAVWAFDNGFLEDIESADEIIFEVEDIDRIERVEF